MNPLIRLCLTFMFTLSAPSLALAQEGGEEAELYLTTEQERLYLEANDALRASPPDYAAAEALLNEALGQGPRFATLLLALGRAHQLADECEQAKALFFEMDEASVDARQQRAALVQKRDEFYRENKTLCSATLTFACEHADTTVFIGQTSYACGEPVALRPGLYDGRAERGGVTRPFSLTLEGGEVRTFNISVSAPAAQVVVTEPLGPQPTPSEPERSAAPWIAAGSTAALTAGLVISSLAFRARTDRLDQEYQDGARTAERFERFNEQKQAAGRREAITGWSALGVGVAGGALATWLFLRRRQERSALLAPAWLGPGAAGALIQARF